MATNDDEKRKKEIRENVSKKLMLGQMKHSYSQDTEPEKKELNKLQKNTSGSYDFRHNWKPSITKETKRLTKFINRKPEQQLTQSVRKKLNLDDPTKEERPRPTKRHAKTPPEWTKQEPGSIVIPEHNRNLPPVKKEKKKSDSPSRTWMESKHASPDLEEVGRSKSVFNNLWDVRYFDQNPAKLMDDKNYKVNKKNQSKVNKILGR